MLRPKVGYGDPLSRPSCPEGGPNALHQETWNGGRLSLGLVEQQCGTGSAGASLRGAAVEQSFYDDTVTLSAEALGLDAHGAAQLSDERSRLSTSVGLSLGSAGATARLGSPATNLTLGVGVGVGMGFGFELDSRRNEDGTRTLSADLGVSLLGRVGVTAKVTTLTPQERLSQEMDYQARFPEGMIAP